MIIFKKIFPVRNILQLIHILLALWFHNICLDPAFVCLFCFGRKVHNNLNPPWRKNYFPELVPNQVLCRYRCMTWRYRRGSVAHAHNLLKVVRRQLQCTSGEPPKIKDQRQPEEVDHGELRAMERVGWDLNSYLQSSGVAVSDECKTYFEDIKKAKKYRWVIVIAWDLTNPNHSPSPAMWCSTSRRRRVLWSSL